LTKQKKKEIQCRPSEDILEGGSTKEVLLLEPELLPAKVVVVGIKDLRDVLSQVFLLEMVNWSSLDKRNQTIFDRGVK
jgi:hypothetical protein